MKKGEIYEIASHEKSSYFIVYEENKSSVKGKFWHSTKEETQKGRFQLIEKSALGKKVGYLIIEEEE